ncbi:NB-ARC domain-containing protein [Streptomyces cinnabarinus]|uniref:NB-ARC domain-containing protein n=1 Tax=Streptomyces cinnabarinus TaxID=67287 RepID=A0ABY7KSC9_9ACTN|nr:NB-ARC domain-containing protein [Streptomyces cinnabarinus]WAZ26918.1 NB-ARC domain-containing protein [Streptomyces cinnabarinus]
MAALVWLLVTAVRDGWGEADPVASVFGSVAGLAALIVSLRALPSAPVSVPQMPAAPDEPEGWVDRREADTVIKAVLRRTWRLRGSSPVAITAGLHGAGGFGKTTLAKYVVAQRHVQRRFPGGVHLITVGRDVRGRTAIAAKVAAETRLITGDTTETGSDPERAGNHLGGLLSRRPRTLLVIDDVWEREQLTPFLRGAEKSCVRLVTTRKPDVLPALATRIEVDRMSVEQARQLLTQRLEQQPEPEVIDDLVRATGQWALLLGLANKFIAEQTATGADCTAVARTLLQKFRAEGPAAQDPDISLDLNDPDSRNTAVRASIQTATTLLQPEHAAQRFAELGIFAADESVPIELVVALWDTTGGLNEAAARSLCKQMADLSLLGIDTSVPGGAVTLHDVVRDYLRRELDTSGLIAANAAFLDAIAAPLPRADDGEVAWWQITHGYLLDHLVEHLLDARRRPEAQALAESFWWIRARLHQRGPTAPWRDLDRIGAPTRALARQLGRAAHLLTPTIPLHALDTILRSRITSAPDWPINPLSPGTPALIDRWLPPDLLDRTLIRSLTGLNDWVRTVAFSPDGSRLATGSDDCTVRIWDPAAGETVHALTGHADWVFAVAFSPDGSRLATASGDRTARIWDPTTGETVRVLTGHRGPVLAAAFSPDGSVLATGSDDGRARIWDATTAGMLHRLTGHSGPVNSVAFSPDGTLLATGSGDGTVRIWDAATYTVLTTLTIHTMRVNVVAFSPDGALLATASGDGTARIWAPTTGEAVATLTGHSGPVNALAFSPDGTLLATASNDETVRIWDPSAAETLRVLTGHTEWVRAVAFSPDGTLLASASDDETVRLWDPAANEPSATLPGHRGPLTAVALSPDGSRLATASNDETVRIWDPATGETLCVLSGHRERVRAVAFNPDGSRLATASNDGTTGIWNPVTGALMGTLTGHSGHVNAVAFSSEGTRLATASNDETVRIWDPATGQQTHRLIGHALPVNTVSFSPDGSLLATGSDDRTVRIWNPATGEITRILTGQITRVNAVAFSPDGTRLASASDDGNIRLWEPSADEAVGRMIGHSGPVNAVAFSPDGSLLATGSDDRTVRIWNPATGEPMTMMRTDSSLLSCVWGPEGRTLYVGAVAGLFAYDLHPALPPA